MNKTMRRFLVVVSVIISVISCSDYDDAQIKNDIKNLQELNDSLVRFASYEKATVAIGDTLELILAPSVTKDTYAAIKADVAGANGDYVSVATRGANVMPQWKIKVLNPEFGQDGKVAKNAAVVITQAPAGYLTDAVLTVTLIDNRGFGHVTSTTIATEKISADLVVYGKIFTSENDEVVEAFAVKDGKFVFVGAKDDVAAFVEEGRTEVLDYSNKGLVMPSCGDGHAHYMMGYAFKQVGTMIGGEDGVNKFLHEIVPAATEKAKRNGSSAIFGFGWNYHIFKDSIPTRQQLDSICSDIPMFFADEEGHKGLANTMCLVKAGIMKEDGTVLKKDKDIRGGEIMMGADGTPNGFLKEQAGTYVRSHLDNDKIYSVDIATANLADIQYHLLSRGYTMYMDGWTNYFFNDHFYQASQRLDEKGQLHVVMGMSHEIESWGDVEANLAKANENKKYASGHILPRWIKLFIDGTVEGGTGYVEPLYPDGHQGIVNWEESEVTSITQKANSNDLSMHIHTMGNKAVNLCVNAFINGGRDEMRNTVVHVRNVLPQDWQRMAEHNIHAVSGILWHHYYVWAPLILWLNGMVPEGMETESYPMKSYFDYGINMSSHTDYPALSGSPDDPFGIMEIAVTGVLDNTQQVPWWTEELLTREQAITALTSNVARQLFIEEERGSISAGKYADFILVDKDVLSCPIKQIHNAKVAATYFEGKEVYNISESR